MGETVRIGLAKGKWVYAVQHGDTSVTVELCRVKDRDGPDHVRLEDGVGLRRIGESVFTDRADAMEGARHMATSLVARKSSWLESLKTMREQVDRGGKRHAILTRSIAKARRELAALQKVQDSTIAVDDTDWRHYVEVVAPALAREDAIRAALAERGCTLRVIAQRLEPVIHRRIAVTQLGDFVRSEIPEGRINPDRTDAAEYVERGFDRGTVEAMIAAGGDGKPTGEMVMELAWALYGRLLTSGQAHYLRRRYVQKKWGDSAT